MEWTIDDGTIFIGDESIEDAIRSVYCYDDGIPIIDIEEVIGRFNRRLLEIEDSNHEEYYNELRDARTILMDRDIPRIVAGFEHVVEEYKQQIENDDCLTMRGLRGSIIEGIAMTEEPTEDDVRAEAENYIKTMSNYSP